MFALNIEIEIEILTLLVFLKKFFGSLKFNINIFYSVSKIEDKFDSNKAWTRSKFPF